MELAQLFVGGIRTWSVADWLIAIVAIAAGIALVYVALRRFGVAIPPWVIEVFWIVIVAFVVIIGIRLVFSI